jgi:hypothetical protein
MLTDWKIKSRAHACAHTGKKFLHEEPIYAAIFVNLDDENNFERRDYSQDAWEEVRTELKPFSFWRTNYEAPNHQVKKEAVGKESAEALLRRFVEEEEANTENARFILAIMLERKKILRQADEKFTDEDARMLIYEHVKTGEVFIVKDPELSLSEVESIQQEVYLLLNAPAPAEELPEPYPVNPFTIWTMATEDDDDEEQEEVVSTYPVDPFTIWTRPNLQ